LEEHWLLFLSYNKKQIQQKNAKEHWLNFAGFLIESLLLPFKVIRNSLLTNPARQDRPGGVLLFSGE
jgi:hypothetical protein